MAVYLSALVPTSKLAAWYPLDNDLVADADIIDESGNGRDVVASNNLVAASQINSRKAVVHVGGSPIAYTGTISGIREVWMIAKVDHVTDFGAQYRGLLSGIADTPSTNYVFVGHPSTARWTEDGPGPTYTYYKSGTLLGSGSRTAPFTYFEQIAARVGNFSLDGLQFGRNKAQALHVLSGKWADTMVFTTDLTNQEALALKLYGDLKFGLWLLNSTTLTFPGPTITNIGWARFKEQPRDWDAVTDTNEYEDAGRSFNTVTDTPPSFWEIGFTGLTKEQADVFDAFNVAARRDRTFSLIDKWGVTNTGVRIVSYERDHEAHKSWSHTCNFTLAKYP